MGVRGSVVSDERVVVTERVSDSTVRLASAC